MKYLAIPLFLMMIACGGGQDHSNHEVHDAGAAVAPKNLPADPVSQLLGAYYQLKSTLVEADSVAADSAAGVLAGLADGMEVKSLVSDSKREVLASNLLVIRICKFRGPCIPTPGIQPVGRLYAGPPETYRIQSLHRLCAGVSNGFQ
jgi:hypothetical protein